MATNHANKSMLGDRIKDSLEQAQQRLMQLEDEAHKVVAVSRKEISNLLQRIGSPELLERNQLKELTGKARRMNEDLGNRIDELRERVITAAGVASRDQVEELARDLEKLSRKLDRFVGARKTPSKSKAS